MDIDSSVSFLANVCTIIATVIAIGALALWRKQQQYGKKIELLMDMEDKYEVLLIGYAERYKWLLELHHLAQSAEGSDLDCRRQTDALLRDNFRALKDDRLNTYAFGYQLAFVRAKRLGLPIDSNECLKLDTLDTFINKFFQDYSYQSYADESSRKKNIEVFSEEFSRIKNSGHQEFEKIRKSF